VWKKQ